MIYLFLDLFRESTAHARGRLVTRCLITPSLLAFLCHLFLSYFDLTFFFFLLFFSFVVCIGTWSLVLSFI